MKHKNKKPKTKKPKTKKPNPPLGTIAEEKLKCREAFRKYPKSKYAWCAHHAIHFEVLYPSAAGRIRYITQFKPVEELALRFRNFRPMKAEYPSEYSELANVRQHNREWPDNSWGWYHYCRRKTIGIA